MKKHDLNQAISEEAMIKIVGDYYAKTGKKEKPVYEQILQMDKDEFQTWMLMRIQAPEQDSLLKEMIGHEEKTGSFAKTFREDDPDYYKLFIDLFNKDKSESVKKVLNDAKAMLEKYGYKSEGDVIKESMMAKAVEDYYAIGRGLEK